MEVEVVVMTSVGETELEVSEETMLEVVVEMLLEGNGIEEET